MKPAVFIFFLLALAPLYAYASGSALVYKSESCGHCTPYVDSLLSALREDGITDIQVKDFLNDAQARREVAAIQADFKVPIEMQGHMLTLINGRYLFEGHFPTSIIDGVVRDNKPDRVVATQDAMIANPSGYLLLSAGQVKQCDISQPIADCSDAGVASGEQSLLKFKVDSNAMVLGGLGIVLVLLVLLYARILK